MKTTPTKPIIFSAPMIHAILDGRKTQTRRIIKSVLPFLKQTTICHTTNVPVIMAHFQDKNQTEGFMGEPAKYQPGDILYVRETWKVGAWRDDDAKVAFDYKASPELKNTPWVEYQDLDRFNDIQIKTIEELEAIDYPREINEEEERFYYHWPAGESPLKWKPSIFMPREAARIFLQVEDVRCERLRDISEEDAIAEGVEEYGPFGEFKGSRHPGGGLMRYRAYEKASRAFQDIWTDIHSNDSWNQNPFVWVYDFKQVEKPTDFLI